MLLLIIHILLNTLQIIQKINRIKIIILLYTTCKMLNVHIKEVKGMAYELSNEIRKMNNEDEYRELLGRFEQVNIRTMEKRHI